MKVSYPQIEGCDSGGLGASFFPRPAATELESAKPPQTVREELPVQMINLVLETDGMHACDLRLKERAVRVLCPHLHMGFTENIPDHARNRHAALLDEAGNPRGNDFGIDVGATSEIIAGNIDNKHAAQIAKLWCRKTETTVVIQCVIQILNQIRKLLIKLLDRL